MIGAQRGKENEISTPTKKYATSKVLPNECRLCLRNLLQCDAYNVFSPKSQEKKLAQKIIRTCGVDMNSSDPISVRICRPCYNFVFKMNEYRDKAQAAQIQLWSNVKVKRMHMSPRALKPSTTSTCTSKKRLQYQPAGPTSTVVNPDKKQSSSIER